MKVSSLVGFSMNEKPAAADFARQVEESQDYVLQKSGSKPLLLMSDVNSKPRKKGNWLRVMSCTLLHSSGCSVKANLRHAPCVVSYNRVARLLCYHKDSSCAARG